MKKLAVLALILSTAAMANAAMDISVNGNIVDEVTIAPSDFVTIDISVDNSTVQEKGSAYWLHIFGPGTIDIYGDKYPNDWTTPEQYVHSSGSVFDYIIDLGDALGADQTIMMDLLIPGATVNDLPTGKVVDMLAFHCEGPGSVTLQLIDSNDMSVKDAVTIIQGTIPEPASMILLGLGGLFLKHRK